MIEAVIIELGGNLIQTAKWGRTSTEDPLNWVVVLATIVQIVSLYRSIIIAAQVWFTLSDHMTTNYVVSTLSCLHLTLSLRTDGSLSLRTLKMIAGIHDLLQFHTLE